MSRYINYDALNKDLGKRWNVSSDQDFADREVWRALREAPSIDIVGCNECAYWQAYENNPDIKVCTRNYRMSFARYPEDYCSRGERKGESDEF